MMTKLQIMVPEIPGGPLNRELHRLVEFPGDPLDIMPRGRSNENSLMPD